jgi:hypothetical protein
MAIVFCFLWYYRQENGRAPDAIIKTPLPCIVKLAPELMEAEAAIQK